MQRRGNNTKRRKQTKRYDKKTKRHKRARQSRGPFWLDVRRGDFYTKYRFKRKVDAVKAAAEYRQKGYQVQLFRQGTKRIRAVKTKAGMASRI